MSNQVIVVGGGLAGLSAAHTLLERGASVLLLDKQGFMGGNSTKATSGINGAGTTTQQEQGVPDSAKIFFEDTKRSARDLARDDLIHVLTHRSGDAVNWLQEKFELDLSKVSRLGGHSQPRTHRGGAQFPGMVITYAQLERLEDLAVSTPDRVKILKKAKVTGLLKEGEAVVGVTYEKDGKSEKAYGPVILATGGYAADFTEDSLLKKHRPELWDLPTTNGDHCTGDGQKIAMAIGAKAIDLEKVQVHPTGLVDPKDPQAKVKFLAAEALRGVGGLLLDNEGQRFADELGHRDYVTGRMWESGKFPIRLVLNGQASKEIEWHCKHYVGRGLMKRVESGEALAKEMGLKPEVLKATFDKYNAGAKAKKDPFGKKFFHGGDFKMNDFFHVAHMTPVLHYTMGGLNIDPESRVISTSGTPIPGLFAAGEVAGGVHGANRLGGSSLLGCMNDFFHVAHMTPVLHYTMGGLNIDPESRVLSTSGAPIPGLFASGEVAGGVHGANRLGGSSLLGCVVFGRVSGDSAAAYLLSSSGNSATSRLGAVKGHLLQTSVSVDESSNKLILEVSWGGQQQGSTSVASSSKSDVPPSADTGKAKEEKEEKAKEAASPEKKAGSYTAEEVAKHNKKDDCWVIIDGQVLDVTNFLADHPGGEKAILLYAGRDATEEFNMLHDPKVIPRYTPESVIGTLKK
ncbi:unnamed protein product [Rhizoctonia solani]|uniref:fumarate reductase (NADH) n=1 Tax=Rhizoctonia solani TaxID=456999 RepID=A0A8H3C8W5_9AGAM|nr:unnamed protein product [Rhizoctonia solani]